MDQKSVSSTLLLLDFVSCASSIRVAREEALTEELLIETYGSYDFETLKKAYLKRLYRNPKDNT
ncbi:MAG: hypothetical protein HYT63_03120 [Candidatus Yanofskybacteria bacterium]|nr:hypothetical protein [Candidatus Yanofskybacteria bacterium]